MVTRNPFAAYVDEERRKWRIANGLPVDDPRDVEAAILEDVIRNDPSLFDRTLGRGLGMAGRGALGVGRAVQSIGPETFIVPNEKAPTTFREALEAPAFQSFLPPEITKPLPDTFVQPFVEQVTSPVGLVALPFSPQRELGATALGIAAPQVAKRAGAGPGVQAAAGIAGGVVGGAPELPIAAGKGLARGAAKAA